MPIVEVIRFLRLDDNSSCVCDMLTIAIEALFRLGVLLGAKAKTSDWPRISYARTVESIGIFIIREFLMLQKSMESTIAMIAVIICSFKLLQCVGSQCFFLFSERGLAAPGTFFIPFMTVEKVILF